MKTYKEIPALIMARQPFKGNSVTAEYSVNGCYKIWSYGTVIYYETPNQQHFNLRKYSVTTTKIQNIIKRIIQIDNKKEVTYEN